MDKNEFLQKYASHLNDNQLKAVQTVDGPILLLAVPGSGKTTVLVTRLGYMLLCQGIDPRNILTLTYTIAATKDMKQRYEKIFGEDAGKGLEFRTINGICYKIIQNYAYLAGKSEDSIFRLITDEKETSRILADILSKLLDDYPTESDIKGIRTLITYCKNMMLSDEEIKNLEGMDGIPLYDAYKAYNEYLKKNSLMDYDDQMIYAYKMLKASPELLEKYQKKYRYICVDEAQDTSKIQHVIIKLLAGTNGNLFMVGDEDQSIYGFRAAYPEALLDFEKDHPLAKVLVMDQNYRSNAKIVALADSFIQNNRSRHSKHMRSTKGEGSDIRYIDLNSRSNQYSYLLKVAADCNRETAVLYRDNESAIPLIDLLDRRQIPFRIKNVDMAFFTHRVVTDVTNIMKFALDPYNTELFMRIYFKCQTYLKKAQAEQVCRLSEEKSIPVLKAVDYIDSINGMVKGKCHAFDTHLKGMIKEAPGKAMYRIETGLGYDDYLERNSIDANKLFTLKAIAANEASVKGFLGRLDYLQNMLKNMQSDYKCPFILSTIHSSKGLEYDQVYLMDICDGVFPSKPLSNIAKPSKTEVKEFEEERRLFYVGMTRAKNDLSIFTFKSKESCLVSELRAPERRAKKASVVSKIVATAESRSAANTAISSDFELIIGERVIQDKQGSGAVSDVILDAMGKIKRFTVSFDSGDEKDYAFPIAFTKGMRLESGQQVPIVRKSKPAPAVKPVSKPVKKPTAVKVSVRRGKDTYASWEAQYPNHVIIKKEGAFWTTRNESAEVLNEVLGYKIGESFGHPMTGSPALDPIIAGLKANRINYIAIEDGQIIDRADFD